METRSLRLDAILQTETSRLPPGRRVQLHSSCHSSRRDPFSLVFLNKTGCFLCILGGVLLEANNELIYKHRIILAPGENFVWRFVSDLTLNEPTRISWSSQTCIPPLYHTLTQTEYSWTVYEINSFLTCEKILLRCVGSDFSRRPFDFVTIRPSGGPQCLQEIIIQTLLLRGNVTQYKHISSLRLPSFVKEQIKRSFSVYEGILNKSNSRCDTCGYPHC